MTKQTMTIHRALSELKTIDARTEKEIENFNPVGHYQQGNEGTASIKVNNLKVLAEFEDSAKSSYQSITDLISRKLKIKTAIVASNAVTKVSVAGNSMTVADAISMKEQIAMKKKLIEVLKAKHRTVFAAMTKNNEKIEENAIKLAEVGLSKQGVKIGDNDAQAIIAPYLKAQRFHLSDAIDVGKEWAKMEKEIFDFEAEVDAVLSETNALTVITIE